MPRKCPDCKLCLEEKYTESGKLLLHCFLCKQDYEMVKVDGVYILVAYQTPEEIDNEEGDYGC